MKNKAKPCKCIDKIVNAQMKGKTRTGKKITMFWFDESAIGTIYNFRTGKYAVKTKSIVRYNVEGRQKTYKSYMIHNFCPFCGNEFPKLS